MKTVRRIIGLAVLGGFVIWTSAVAHAIAIGIIVVVVVAAIFVSTAFLRRLFRKKSK